MMQTARFDYDQAFVRNLGWVTEAEQLVLRGKRVAIAGLGGVGGVHLLTLARLGIGRFSVADMDLFDVANFNRQIGATVSTLGRPKVDVLVEMARDINPELDIRAFGQGVTRDNLDAFLEEADCYVDGLDYFAFPAREMVFAACADRGIPAVTAAPIGMGTALLCFMPGGMTFEQYFRLSGCDDAEKAIRLLVGLAPRMLHRGYLVDRSRVDFAGRRGPSTAMACQACAGVAGTEVLKLLLGRGRVRAAPWAMQFDAYTGSMRWSWRPGGNANPLQRFTIAIGRRQLGCTEPTRVASPRRDTPRLPPDVASTPTEDDMEAILRRLVDAAVLAPSADNRHHARFELARTAVRLCCPQNELQSMPRHRRLMTLLTFGAMGENMIVQASGLGLASSARWFPNHARPDLILELHVAGASCTRDPLALAIPHRHTNRRFYRRQPATAACLARLTHQVEQVAGTQLSWFDDPDSRRAILRLIRIAETERFARQALHREMFGSIRFDVGWSRTAEVGLPPGSLEVERPLRAVFGAMRHWPVMRLLNLFGAHRLLGLRAGDLPCRLAPHVGVIATDESPEAGAIAAGRAFERLWLQATAEGLSLQPLAAAAYFPLQCSEAEGTSEASRIRLQQGWRDLLPNRTALMLFRMGYAVAPSLSTARADPEVLITSDA